MLGVQVCLQLEMLVVPAVDGIYLVAHAAARAGAPE
jgi:hypothetical protein